MRRPFWREQTRHWYVKADGKAVRLTDEPCARTKTPPPHVERAWHALTRQGVPDDIRVADVFEHYTAACTGSHRASVARILGEFEAFVGGKTKAAALRPFHLTNFFAAKPKWGPATQRTAVDRIHAAVNYAVKQGRLGKNPISSTPGYKRQGYYRKVKGTITPDLRDRLEAEARPATRAILVALRETGCRPVELRRMRIEKCDLERGVAMVPNKTARQTGQAERPIYLSDEVKRVMRERIGDRTDGFVFLTARGKPWSYGNLEERWWGLTKRIGGVTKGISLYTYRRSFISAAINDRNVNPVLVAQLVGHVGLDMMLKHYAQEDPEALKKAVEAITRQLPRRRRNEDGPGVRAGAALI